MVYLSLGESMKRTLKQKIKGERYSRYCEGDGSAVYEIAHQSYAAQEPLESAC